MDVIRNPEVQIELKETLLWSIYNSSFDAVDRLLNDGVELPDYPGAYHIVVNGVPLCKAEEAFSGAEPCSCGFSSLHPAIRNRNAVKAQFPGAIVAIRAGRCPEVCGRQPAA